MSKTIKPIPHFNAIYNPFTRELVVKYGSKVTEYTFTDSEEWTEISYNGDVDHPCYLHVQLDFDENLQLLFYPRIKGNDSLHEDLGSYFHHGHNCSPNIKIVYNDEEMTKFRTFLEYSDSSMVLLQNDIEIDFHSWTETHFEVVSVISYHARQDVISSPVVAERQEASGIGGLYELAMELTNEFETINRGREWDGEFFDEIDTFIEEKLK